MTVYSRNHGEVTEAEAQVSRSSRQLKLEAMSAIESEETRSCDGEDQKQLCLLDKGCDATDYRMEPNLDCSVVVLLWVAIPTLSQRAPSTFQF